MGAIRKAIAAATLLVAGCAAPARGETFSLQEAYARIDKHIHNAIAHLSPPPDLRETFSSTAPCTDMVNNETGEYTVERHYALTGGPAANSTVFETLYRYWTENGYRVTNDLRYRPAAPLLTVEHGEDSFSVSLRQNLASELDISAGSPCIRLTDPPS
jgi:hypothetical protein